MNDRHVTFEKMSDLYDENIFIEEEKDVILNHIESCPACKSKYYELRKTLSLLSKLRNQNFDLNDLPARTIKIIKSKKRKKILLKAIPAIAASFLLIIGLGMFNLGLFNKNGIYSDSERQLTSNDDSAKINDIERVINIIRNHKAKILKVSDLYIEGEVPIEKFRRLRRDLGFRKVSYSLFIHSSPVNSPANSEKIYEWKTNIEEVAVGNNRVRNQDQNGSLKHVKNIRFRVFR